MLVHHALERAAQRWPSSSAVEHGALTVTYADLDRSATELGALLASIGVRRGDRVAIWMEKSIAAVTAIYGTLKTGAVYVPIDPSAPAARAVQITDDCTIAALVADPSHALGAADVVRDAAPVICLDPETTDVVARADVHSRVSAPSPRYRAPPLPISLDLAYVLYTSGSTGRPKGVKLTHRNCLAFVEWAVRRYDVRHEDRLSSHAPFHFDLSTFDLFGAACAGACVVLVPATASMFPRALAEFIESARITTWYSVPSVLSMLATRGGLHAGALPHLRRVVFAGEVFPTKHLRTLMASLPHVRFANWYGPTETNVCTYYDVPPALPDDDAPIPIGYPIDDVELLVIGADGDAAPPGTPGELLVRGPTVMQGYWGDAERTARVLVPHPHTTEVTDRCYRTGDLVVVDHDGLVHFLGRADDQVKSAGHRVELGDIEAAFLRHPRVVECAVVAVPDDVFTNRLVGVAVVDGSTTSDELRRFCGELLPPYMVPERVDIREELPKTSTGKLDRRALAAEVGGR